MAASEILAWSVVGVEIDGQSKENINGIKLESASQFVLSNREKNLLHSWDSTVSECPSQMTTNCWSRKLALQSWINSSFVRAAISRSSETPLGLRGLRVIGASDCNLLLLISFSLRSRGYDIVGCPWYGSCCDLVTTIGGPWFCIFTVLWLNLSSILFSVLYLRISFYTNFFLCPYIGTFFFVSFFIFYF